MNFKEWMAHEASRIVSLGFNAPEDKRAEWMAFQIELALKKALAHGRDGLTEMDEPRPYK
jgi:hypothetical protein